MRDVELYRRPAFLVGDAAAVERHTKGFRAKRRAVQVSFLAAVAGIAGAVTVLDIDSLLTVTLSFAVASSLFIVLHLAAGKRLWMKPIEAYEDGVSASQITALFCRRRFAAWTEVTQLTLASKSEAEMTLTVVTTSGRVLESAPGEVDERGLKAMRERLDRARAEAAERKAIFDQVGAGGSADG